MEPTSTLGISKADLEDPNLTRVNAVIGDLYRKIGAITNNGKLTGTTNLEIAKMPVTTGTPDDNDLLTWGVAKRLLSPQAQRTAMIKNSWLGTPVRPITGLDVPANSSGLAQSIVDTHAARGGYPATSYDIGSFYYETDRDALYQVQNPGGVKTWVWVWDNMYDVLSNQPSDLGVNDEGFLFYSTDTLSQYIYRWDGSAWDIVEYHSDNITTVNFSNTAATAPSFFIDRGRGTASSPSSANTNDYIGSLIFRALRNSGATFTSAASITCLIESTPSSSTAAGRIIFQTSDNSGSAVLARWEITADGDLIPSADVNYNIGSSSAKPWQIHGDEITAYSTMSLLTGGSLGDVITNDGSDNFVWSAASSGTTNDYLSANATATDTLTTSYADTTGCTLNLNIDGYWLVMANVLFLKGSTDTECSCQLVFDGVAQSGITGISPPTATTYTGMASRQWVVQVTSQPKVAKLQCKKTSGGGTSQSIITNTNIIAVYLKP